MTMITVPQPTRSLEDLRHEQLMSIEEWARHLRMTEQTYRRRLADPQSVRPATKRRGRAILNLTPYEVREFYPPPSPTRAAAAVAAYRRGNAEGWIATDPNTGAPTGEVVYPCLGVELLAGGAVGLDAAADLAAGLAEGVELYGRLASRPYRRVLSLRVLSGSPWAKTMQATDRSPLWVPPVASYSRTMAPYNAVSSRHTEVIVRRSKPPLGCDVYSCIPSPAVGLKPSADKQRPLKRPVRQPAQPAWPISRAVSGDGEPIRARFYVTPPPLRRLDEQMSACYTPPTRNRINLEYPMTTPNQYDTPWKEALERYLPEFFAFFFPAIAPAIDWARGYTFLDTELQQVTRDAELGRRLADKLVQVWRRAGDPIWVLVHLEVQSQEEPAFARRMLTYHYRLLDRYDRPVVSLAVLGDERASWRPNAVQLGLWGCTLAFTFPIVKLLDYAAEEAALLADRNPFATVVLAHRAAQATRHQPAQRQATKFALTRRLYALGYARQEILDLFRFIDWLLQLPDALEMAFWQEIAQYEEAQQMTYITSVERRGIAQGRAEGLAEGEAKGLRAGIALALELKFGAAGLALLPELETISDVAQLEALAARLRTAATVEELRPLGAG